MDLNASIVIFVRLDNAKRRQNLKAVIEYYSNELSNIEFIIVEDSWRPDVLEDPTLMATLTNTKYTYVYVQNNAEWNKSAGYNNGIKLAKYNNIIFNDVDAIIEPSQLQTAIESLYENDLNALCYPYNGEWLCTTDKIKQEFASSHSYNDLDKYYPLPLVEGHSAKDFINTTTPDGVLIGHYNSRGGCVVGRRDNLVNGGGYNPNFVGWGYEDDELPARFHRLGYGVTRVNGQRKPCWHLDHTDNMSSKKENQPNYEENRQIAGFVDTASKEQLEEYIKTWAI